MIGRGRLVFTVFFCSSRFTSRSARKPSLVACEIFDYQRWHCFCTLENQGYQVDRVVVFLIIFESD